MGSGPRKEGVTASPSGYPAISNIFCTQTAPSSQNVQPHSYKMTNAQYREFLWRVFMVTEELVTHFMDATEKKEPFNLKRSTVQIKEKFKRGSFSKIVATLDKIKI